MSRHADKEIFFALFTLNVQRLHNLFYITLVVEIVKEKRYSRQHYFELA